jgi:hypothetical protein
MPDFWVNGKPCRSPTTTPTCCRRCATTSGSRPRRTAARPRASAAVAPCWSTARPRCRARSTSRRSRARRHHARGFSDDERDVLRGVRRQRWAAVRVLHPRHRRASEVAGRQKGADLTRDDLQRHIGAHLCRCTGYVKVLRRHRGGGAGDEIVRATSGGHRGGGAKYEAEARARRPGLHRRHGRARHGCTPRCTSPRTPGPTSSRSTPPRRSRRPGVTAVFTAADIPGDLKVGIIYTDWPVMIPVGGRTSYAGDVLAVVVAETRRQARAASLLIDVTYDVLDPVTDPVAALADGATSPCGAPTPTSCPCPPIPAATSTVGARRERPRRARDVPTQRIEHAFLEPESTFAVPSPGDGRRRTHRSTSTRAGRACGTTATRSRRCSARSRPGHRRARLERRRLRRQGGHVEPGAHRARRVAPRSPGQVHAQPRGELSHPRQAAPDRDGVLGRVRRNRSAHRAEVPHDRRLRPYASVGMKVLERAAGSRLRPLPGAEHRRRRGRCAHQQPGVRCVPRVRRQPGPVRDGRRDRPTRRTGRHLRVGRCASAT